MTKEIVVGLPGSMGAAGRKPAISKVRAAPIVGKLGPSEEPPQPASASVASTKAAARLMRRASGTGTSDAAARTRRARPRSGRPASAESRPRARRSARRRRTRGPVPSSGTRAATRGPSRLPQIRKRSPSRSFAPRSNLDDTGRRERPRRIAAAVCVRRRSRPERPRRLRCAKSSTCTRNVLPAGPQVNVPDGLARRARSRAGGTAAPARSGSARPTDRRPVRAPRPQEDHRRPSRRLVEVGQEAERGRRKPADERDRAREPGCRRGQSRDDDAVPEHRQRADADRRGDRADDAGRVHAPSPAQVDEQPPEHGRDHERRNELEPRRRRRSAPHARRTSSPPRARRARPATPSADRERPTPTTRRRDAAQTAIASAGDRAEQPRPERRTATPGRRCRRSPTRVPSTATGIEKRPAGPGFARRRRGEPVVVPGERAPAADANPARAILRDEPVGCRSRRARVHPHAVVADPEHRLAQDAAHEQLDAVVHARLERPVAVEHAHVHARQRGRGRVEPEAVVERDRRTAPVRRRRARKRERGRADTITQKATAPATRRNRKAPFET